MQTEVPILLMAFIRPDLVKRAMERLSKFAPPILYVMGDGPRSESEASLCEQSRKIAMNPTWECEVIPILNDDNQGVVASFVKGMNIMFSEHEFGIYLEDDIMLSESFYDFAQEILLTYRDDTRIGHVNSTNFIPHYDPKDYEGSYFFSEYAFEWGFATWKRMWDLYDVKMLDWRDVNQKKMLGEHCFNSRERKSLKRMFDLHCDNPRPLAWGYQWLFSCLHNKALAVTPKVNMSLNVGFNRNDSTNTSGENPVANPIANCRFPLIHPSKICRDAEYDDAVSKLVSPSYLSVFSGKARNRILAAFKSLGGNKFS
ncbi:MAG: hypothetical protein VYA10_01680 [Verrucomicrobiota bacterium]|nr:hypothetical protein [Verrucomicrobiota bacterium]